MNGQTEREYRKALDGLRFPREAKERMMDNLMEQKGQRSAKRRAARPLRTALIAAAVCLALVGTALAANVIVGQARIIYLDKEQFAKEYNEYFEEHGKISGQYNDGSYSGMDFKETSVEDWELWWEGPLGELVEETAGTAQDGWTAKRVFECSMGGVSYGLGQNTKYLEARYRAEHVSDYDSLWDGWDISWLEEHYVANPNFTFARIITHEDKPYFIGLGGEFRGEGGAMFNMTYSWSRDFTYEDEFRVAGKKAFAELYTTPDGMELAIEMDTSETGKSVFWVTLSSGNSSFSMFGTQMGLDGLHDILDSLNLSKVMEYDPAK